MFQLIVAVISIALVAALAIASIYYGGSAFNKSSLKANVTTLVNGGQQIAGAVALYRTDNSIDPSDVATLVTYNYLQGAPGLPGIASSTAWGWTAASGSTPASVSVALKPASAAEACLEVAKQAGTSGQFGCDASNNFYFNM